MDTSNIINTLKSRGFKAVSKKSYGTILKSNNGVSIEYNDGNIEGFIKSSLNESIVNELGLRRKIEVLILIGLGITYFNTDLTIVDGISMDPTLKNHQIILKTKSSTNVNKILASKNSIVKFKTPEGDTAIKRIIGTPGDEIELDRAIIKINGEVVDKDNRVENEKSLLSRVNNKSNKTEPKKFKLGKNQYYMLGDNRPHSIDSRNYGAVDKVNILSIIQK